MQRTVDFLAPGEMPMYDKDSGVSAFVVGEEGQNIVALATPRRVLVPHWPLVAKSPIRLSMTDTAVSRTGAVLCHSIAGCLTKRVQAVVDAAQAVSDDIEGEYMLIVPVMQSPVVFFGEVKDSKELELIVEVVLGIGAFPVAPAAPAARNAQDKLPAETATMDTFLIPIEADWTTFDGQQHYADQLRHAARKGLLGSS